jgi:hypothetical protein
MWIASLIHGVAVSEMNDIVTCHSLSFFRARSKFEISAWLVHFTTVNYFFRYEQALYNNSWFEII